MEAKLAEELIPFPGSNLTLLDDALTKVKVVGDGDSISVIVQVTPDLVVCTIVNSHYSKSVQSNISNLIETGSNLFEFINGLATDRLSGGSIFNFVTVNNKVKQYYLVSCHIETLECQVVAQTTLENVVDSIITTINGVYVVNHLQHTLTLVDNSPQHLVLKYDLDLKEVLYYNLSWYGYSEGDVYTLRQCNNMLERQDSIFSSVKISQGISTGHFLVFRCSNSSRLSPDRSEWSYSIFGGIIRDKSKVLVNYVFQDSLDDINAIYEWRNTLVFSKQSSFKMFMFPNNFSASASQNIIFHYVTDLNSSFFVDTQHVITALPNRNSMNGLSLLSKKSGVGNNTFYLNQLLIDSPSIDCTNASNEILESKKYINFSVCYDSLNGTTNTTYYSIYFYSDKKKIDYRLLVILGSICVFILGLLLFTWVKVKQVNFAKKELSKSKKMVDKSRVSFKSEDEDKESLYYAANHN